MTTLLETIAADRPHFLDPSSGFGEVFVKPDASEINGIMRDGFESVEDPRQPIALFQTADLSDLAHGAALLRQSDGTLYTLEGARPDESGMSEARLVRWTPLELPALLGWWDFADNAAANMSQQSGSQVDVTDGDPIGRIVDKSTQGNDWIQSGADALKPVWRSRDGGFADFDGAQYFDPKLTFFTPSAPRSVALSFVVTSALAGSRGFALLTGTARFIHGTEVQGVGWHQDNTPAVWTSGISALNLPRRAVVTFASAAELNLYIDGAINTIDPQDNFWTNDPFYLPHEGGAQGIVGFYTQVIAGQKEWSVTEINLIDRYLAARLPPAI